MILPLFLASLLTVTTSPVIQYSIHFNDAPRHTIDIEMLIPTEGKSEVELMMPTWTPGSYLIREYARNIEEIHAYQVSDGLPLTLQKKEKNRWVVHTNSQPQVMIRYRLYCREMSVRTNWVEKDWALLTGAGTFITVPSLQQHAHKVRLHLPDGWENVATSLTTISTQDAYTVEAKNYDELVDSPILLGALRQETIEAGGTSHRLVNVADEHLWDMKKAATDSAKIIEQQQKFWGVVPYENYVFLNVAAESGGGLEHDNSCVLMTSRWQQKKRDSYIGWLSLVSHEFFHAWNVRRLRPKVLKNYDYENEQIFDELWIAEGITSYYDDLFVARSGLMTAEEYLERLSKTIGGMQGTPGRNVQSLIDSSRDAWIKLYRPDENSSNTRISYYVKGAVVAALLDAQIRQKTNHQRSLDDVMRRLWQDHLETGYTQEDFNKIVHDIAGPEVVTWLQHCISTTDELDYAPLLNAYGLQFKQPKIPAAGEPLDVFLGADASLTDGRLMIKRIMRDSPAHKAGLNVDDEWLAINNFRVGSDWNDRLSHYQPDDEVELLVARRGKLVRVPVRLGVKPAANWKLESIKEPSAEQKAAFANWLQLPTEAKAETKSETETPKP